jgi:sulfotransferase family protein
VREPELPNFLIVGAGKSGTTSLYRYLRQHPQIYMSPIKEPCYFASEIRVENLAPFYPRQTRRMFEDGCRDRKYLVDQMSECPMSQCQMYLSNHQLTQLTSCLLPTVADRDMAFGT